MAEQKRMYICPKCGTPYTSLDNFPAVRGNMYTGWSNHIPYCRECVDGLFYKYVDDYDGDEEKAIYRICQIFNVYYCQQALDASLKRRGKSSRIRGYLHKASTLSQCAGKSFDDTLVEEKSAAIIEKYNLLEQDESTTENCIDEETIKFFGKGFNDEEYEWLQNEYDDWTTRNECKTKSQELIFKRICLKELEIEKATLSGLSTKELDATLQQLLDTGNLKPKQTNMDALAEDRTFGQLIRIWENEKPIPEPSPEFKDVDGIGRYISVFFLGHLAKMVGIKNKYARMYEEEMAKYAVQKPEYEEDSEALFDAIFGGHLESNQDD